MTDLDGSRAYVVHLRAEHQRLHDVVRRIFGLFHVPDEEPHDSKLRLVEGLRSLRDELSRHFSEEEEGGCIEEAICRCPSLSSEGVALEGQHPALLWRLEIILGCVETVAVAHVPSEIERKFAEFAQQLHEHEARKNRLLARAFGASGLVDFELT